MLQALNIRGYASRLFLNLYKTNLNDFQCTFKFFFANWEVKWKQYSNIEFLYSFFLVCQVYRLNHSFNLDKFEHICVILWIVQTNIKTVINNSVSILFWFYNLLHILSQYYWSIAIMNCLPVNRSKCSNNLYIAEH